VTISMAAVPGPAAPGPVPGPAAPAIAPVPAPKRVDLSKCGDTHTCLGSYAINGSPLIINHQCLLDDVGFNSFLTLELEPYFVFVFSPVL